MDIHARDILYRKIEELCHEYENNNKDRIQINVKHFGGINSTLCKWSNKKIKIFDINIHDIKKQVPSGFCHYYEQDHVNIKTDITHIEYARLYAIISFKTTMTEIADKFKINCYTDTVILKFNCNNGEILVINEFDSNDRLCNMNCMPYWCIGKFEFI